MRIYLVYSENYKELLVNQNVLVSYARLPKEFKALEMPNHINKVIIDSGAFSLSTGAVSDAEVNINGYVSWLQFFADKYKDRVAGYFNFDKLGDADQTLKNQKWLEYEGLNPIPVWHKGSDKSYLDYYCSNYEYIGLGGIAASARYFGDSWDTIAQKNPDNKFHLFAMGISGFRALKNFQPYSVDFTTWLDPVIYGRIPHWNGKKYSLDRLPLKVREKIRLDKEFRFSVLAKSIDTLLSLEDFQWDTLFKGYQMEFQ